MIFRSGNANGAYLYFCKGVAAIDPKRWYYWRYSSKLKKTENMNYTDRTFPT